MKTYSYLIAATLLFIIVLSGYGLAYRTLGSISDEVISLTAQVAGKNADAAQALGAEKELTKLATQEAQIHGYFVASSDIVPFLESLQNMGAGTGVKVNVAAVAENKTPRPHLDISLKITGPFDAVVRTVGAIEYSPHDIQVTTLALDATPGEKETIWTASMAMRVGTASSSSAMPAASKALPSNSTGTASTTP
jgi:hypothetical protein